MYLLFDGQGIGTQMRPCPTATGHHSDVMPGPTGHRVRLHRTLRCACLFRDAIGRKSYRVVLPRQDSGTLSNPVASTILSIAFVLCFVPPVVWAPLSFFLALLDLIIHQRSRKHGLAVAALILSIIGGIFWVIGVIALANGGWSDFVEWNF